MAQRKYISLSKLSTFLENLKSNFASILHKHTISDITDYKVDDSLSSTSENPVKNKVLDAEFEAISTAMNALESAIDEINETDPTVPAWAKAETKPTYTAEEVGALPNTTKLADLADDSEHRTVTDDEKNLWNGAAENSGGTPVVTTAGTGAAYTATVDGITALTAGIKFVMIPHTASTSKTPTLNVNSLGAKGIRRRLNTSATSIQTGYSANWLASGKPFTLIYDGAYWIAEDRPKPSAVDMYGTLAIANGGTGATDAATALANLGAASSADLSALAATVGSGVKIQTGSYAGSGTVTLTLDFAPKIIFFGSSFGLNGFWMYGTNRIVPLDPENYWVDVTSSTETFTFKRTDSSSAYNWMTTSGTTYYYVALG